MTEPSENPAFRDWVAPDTRVLNLGCVFITIPAEDGRSQAHMYRALGRTNGIVRAMMCGDGARRKIIAIALVDGEADRRRLRAQLDEVAYEWQWDEVDHETVEPALATWRHLTRLSAHAEGLELGSRPPTRPQE